jgi:hypothetical protein
MIKNINPLKKLFFRAQILSALRKKNLRRMNDYFMSGNDYPAEFDKILAREFWNILA